MGKNYLKRIRIEYMVGSKIVVIHLLYWSVMRTMTWVEENYVFGWDDDELPQHAQATGLVYYNSFDDVPNTLK